AADPACARKATPRARGALRSPCRGALRAARAPPRDEEGALVLRAAPPPTRPPGARRPERLRLPARHARRRRPARTTRAQPRDRARGAAPPAHRWFALRAG